MAKKYNVGFTVGVFDLFHVGHLNLLERCKEQCEYLKVAICDDDYVRNVKGVEPVYSQEDRMRIMKAIRYVDEVVSINIEDTEDKMKALEKYGFDVLFSGDDWKGTERYNKTEEEFARLGVSIEYLPYTQGVSTTATKEKVKSKSK